MDQRRFEQTFREIVRKLNEIGGEVKPHADLQPARVVSDRKDDARSARSGQRSQGT